VSQDNILTRLTFQGINLGLQKGSQGFEVFLDLGE
jgi:hypothetical protein